MMNSSLDLTIKSFQNLDDISIFYTFSNLEYLLKEVRIIYLKDVDLHIYPFININAKEGDMTSIPRWISVILSKEKLIEIHDEDNLSYIKRALNRERISPNHELSSIDTDFYVRVNNYLHSIEEKDREALLKDLNSFITTRIKKIVTISPSSPLIPKLEEKISLEEKILYETFYKVTLNFKKLVLKHE